MAGKILNGVDTKKPSNEAFDDKITHLHKVQQMISEMKTSTDIGWLRVNSGPLQKSLQMIITQWISRYTNFLLNNTINEINNIQAFNEEVTKGIKVLPESSETKKEKELLMQVMTHLRDVKMIKDHTLSEIEPMKQTIVLLKKHGITMNEDFLVKLENSKTALIEVSERALGPVKE
jgi:dynein heavy chain